MVALVQSLYWEGAFLMKPRGSLTGSSIDIISLISHHGAITETFKVSIATFEDSRWMDNGHDNIEGGQLAPYAKKSKLESLMWQQ